MKSKRIIFSLNFSNPLHTGNYLRNLHTSGIIVATAAGGTEASEVTSCVYWSNSVVQIIQIPIDAFCGNYSADNRGFNI